MNRTDADIIAHLDADTIPSRRWLANMVAPFENPSTIIVAGTPDVTHDPIGEVVIAGAPA